MFEVVSYCSEGECLEKGLNSSYSFQIRFIEERLSHWSRNIKENCDGLFGVSCYNGFEIFQVDDFFNTFTFDIWGEQIEIDWFLFTSEYAKYVTSGNGSFTFSKKNKEFVFFSFQEQISCCFGF